MYWRILLGWLWLYPRNSALYYAKPEETGGKLSRLST
jgi:hypothetical protein